MRIMMTIHHHLDADAGAPGVTLRIAEEYRRRGHEVRILSFDDLPGPSEIARSVMFPFHVARQIRRERRVDLVDASTGDLHLVTARPGGPLLVTRSHGLEHSLDERTRTEAASGGPPLSWKYPIYHGGIRLQEVRRSLRRSHICLLLNADDQRRAIEMGVGPEAAAVVSNGLPPRLIGRRPPRFTPDQAPLQIAVLGSYLPRKGSAYLSAALNEILMERPAIRVSFFGTGVPAGDVLQDLRPEVRAQVDVVERYRNTDLPELLADKQVHLFPTLFEGGPVSLLESMACGLAPVVTDIPAMTEVVRDRDNGYLVRPGDSSDIVRTILEVAADRVGLRRVQASAHASAQQYSWTEVVSRQLRLFEAASCRTRGYSLG